VHPVKVAIAFDHRGVVLRARIRAELESLGCEIVDLGAHEPWPRVGAEIVGGEVAAELVQSFVRARFSGGPRHVRRLEKLAELEQRATS